MCMIGELNFVFIGPRSSGLPYQSAQSISQWHGSMCDVAMACAACLANGMVWWGGCAAWLSTVGSGRGLTVYNSAQGRHRRSNVASGRFSGQHSGLVSILPHRPTCDVDTTDGSAAQHSAPIGRQQPILAHDGERDRI
jgi:hypothetical protein